MNVLATKISDKFYFGEEKEGYDVRVLNERELRAAAGILFAFAMVAFLNAFLVKSFFLLKLFILTFLLDFIIRILINPQFSPTLILGRIFVQNQRVEYTGAPQKRFAWSLGLGMSFLMFFIVIVYEIRGPLPLTFCLMCLTLLFLETAFGICIGCKIFELVKKQSPQYCPGDVCEIIEREDIQIVKRHQVAILFGFGALMTLLVFAARLS